MGVVRWIRNLIDRWFPPINRAADDEPTDEEFAAQW